MRTIDHLEMHVVHSCNLSCESCSHYSNHRHKGIIALEEADRWMQAWRSRLEPRRFTLLGGEPTIHPDLTGFLKLARHNFPGTQLRIITNGWFLHRHPQLPAAVAADPDASILISVHHDSPEYKAKLDPIFELAGKWIREHRISIEVERSWQRWTRRYRGAGAAMEPYDDRSPAQSWENCVARFTPQLHEGKLWKCAPLAYLGLQHRKVGLSDKWAPYLDYQPLAPDCSDAELDEFLNRREESYCGMCPARPERFALPMPFSSTGPVQPGRATAPPKTGSAMAASTHTAVYPIPAAPTPAPGPPLHSLIHPLTLPFEQGGGVAFKSFPILRGPSAIVSDFESHASVLGRARSPHPPHQHVEEEILIVLDGQAELIMRTPGASPEESRVRMGPGAFVYYPAFSTHSIFNAGQMRLSYLMFKWRSDDRGNDGELKRSFAEFPRRVPKPGASTPRAVAQRTILEGRTRYLDKLHCHVTLLQPGGGYAVHADEHDVAIVMLEGIVETLGRRVEPHGVIYYAAGEPHGMHNPGTTPALYLVFEFHGPRVTAPS